MSISRNSLITFIYLTVQLFVSMVAGVIITRALGPEGKGTYAITYVLILTLLDVFGMNIDVSTVYHLGLEKYRANQFIPIYFVTSAIAGAISATAGFFLSDLLHQVWLSNIDVVYIRIAFLSFPVILLRQQFASVLWGLHDIKGMNIARTSQRFFLVGLSAIIALSTDNVLYFILGNVGSYVLSTATSLYLLRNHIRPLTWKVDLSLMKKLYAYGIKGSIGRLLTSIAYKVGPFAVTYFLGIRAMGFYSVAMYAEFLWRIPQAINVALLPILSSQKTKGKAELTCDITRNTLLITSACVLLMIPASWILITTLFGTEFTPSITPFCILLLGTGAYSISQTIRNYFYGIGKPQIDTYVSIFVIVATPPLFYFFIKWWALNGAALAAASCYMLTATTLLIIFLKTTGSRLSNVVIPKMSDCKNCLQVLKKMMNRAGAVETTTLPKGQ